MPRDASDLFRLVYRSRSTLAGTAEDVRRAIEAVVAASQRRNAQVAVTGALMFTGVHFVQALEGPAAAVEATFDRICCDLSHVAIEVVECGPVLEPAFGAWSMSHLVPDADAEALLAGAAEVGELVDAAAAAVRLMAALIKAGPPPRDGASAGVGSRYTG